MIRKKGFAYVTAASLIIAVVLLIFLSNQKYTLQDKEELTMLRVRNTNDFIKGLNMDISRATEISSFRALLSLEDYAATNGQYFTNLSESFKETFYNGTIEGENVTLMFNSSFKDYLLKINQIGNNIGLIIDISLNDVEIYHTGPWTVQILLDMNINISDSARIANWIYNRNFSADMSILNLRDPIYGVNTGNKIPNTIRIFNESPLVTTDNNTDNLQEIINQSYYVESAYSPTFLMRFENNDSADPFGIESIVNLQTLSDQDLEVYPDRIKVDYIYFKDLGGDKICDVQNIPTNNYFVITENRKNIYQIENLTYNETCP